MNEGVYVETHVVCEVLFLFDADVTRECNDNYHVAVEANKQELDNLDDVFMDVYLEVAVDTHAIVYTQYGVSHGRPCERMGVS
jgi:hypothetical protein